MTRKMTFTLPEEIAARLVKRVRARDRSRYVTEAIAARLRDRDKRLIRACELANANEDVSAIEREWDDLADAVAEPWDDVSPR